jgi:hypothetical protein
MIYLYIFCWFLVFISNFQEYDITEIDDARRRGFNLGMAFMLLVFGIFWLVEKYIL